jgi:uncharacterized protein YcsI (UPF0317 family)
MGQFDQPHAVRALVREGRWSGSTAGAAPGYAQANLVVLRRDWADEFRLFCLANPRPCPLLDVTAAGSPHPYRVAPAADLRTDVPGYRVYERDAMRQLTDLRAVWQDDFTAFLLGCSFSFERSLIAAGVPMRHIELGLTVPMYVSNLQCAPVGRLHGPLVVSMRPIARERADEVAAICAQFPGAHGAPMHVGDPSALGIADLSRPDNGDPVPLKPGEIPAFWACGVTPQVVLHDSGCDWFATHEPGHMFVTDRVEDLAPLDA